MRGRTLQAREPPGRGGDVLQLRKRPLPGRGSVDHGRYCVPLDPDSWASTTCAAAGQILHMGCHVPRILAAGPEENGDTLYLPLGDPDNSRAAPTKKISICRSRTHTTTSYSSAIGFSPTRSQDRVRVSARVVTCNSYPAPRRGTTTRTTARIQIRRCRTTAARIRRQGSATIWPPDRRPATARSLDSSDTRLGSAMTPIQTALECFRGGRDLRSCHRNVVARRGTVAGVTCAWAVCTAA